MLEKPVCMLLSVSEGHVCTGDPALTTRPQEEGKKRKQESKSLNREDMENSTVRLPGRGIKVTDLDV